MIRSISKFSSLNFNNDWRPSFQREADYSQFFAFSDQIRVQIWVDNGTDLKVYLTNLVSGEVKLQPLEVVEKLDITNTQIQEVCLESGTLEPSCYMFEVRDGYKPMAVSYFTVVDDNSKELENTVLLSYTHDSNFYDVHFVDVGGTHRFFDVRVEGGFLPEEVTFGVDQESFRDQRFTMSQLSALPYTMKMLTIGNGGGVPYWMGEKINLLFACDTVLIDGVAYVRGEGAVPEVNPVIDNYPMAVYKLQVEKDDFYNYDVRDGLKLDITYSWGDFVNVYEKTELVITYEWGEYVNIHVEDVASYSDDYSDDFQN